MSGAFGGLAVSHVLTPVELVKCRLQVRHMVSITAPGRSPGQAPVPFFAADFYVTAAS